MSASVCFYHLVNNGENHRSVTGAFLPVVLPVSFYERHNDVFMSFITPQFTVGRAILREPAIWVSNR